ncbi:MAG TPA: hypothetical protein PLM14_04610 [Candidatus Hydrogenedentes bacterium]|nr:hypothetical protein [Candidatus Hydrogenedentota bacterium]HQM48011.1 hypothetical protein [Candidatus Hydrogenedentota bacterium]
MVALFIAAHAVLLTGVTPPIVFFEPTDIDQAQGLEISLRMPESKVELIAADPDRPSLWYAPAASHTVNNAVYIWYQRVEKEQPEYADQRTLCLGMVAGGQWTIPSVHEDAPPWGGPNNIVMRRSPYPPTWGGFNVFQILPHEGAYHMVYWDQPAEGNAGAMHAVSPDGINWTKEPPGTLFTEYNDAFTIIKAGDEFLMYQTLLQDWPDKPFADNLPGRRRVQALRTSKDLLHWTDQEVILAPDENDTARAEFYYMRPFHYCGRYAALLMKYYADPAKPDKHSALTETELIVSNDGRQWRRPFRQTNLGFWTMAEPFEDHNRNLCFPAHEGGGMVLYKYLHMRLSGVTAKEEGSLVTPVIELTEGDLVMDADARNGSIEVELLNEDGSAASGFYPTTYENVFEESIVLSWENFEAADVPMTNCRLRITLNNATLYSIRYFGQ